MDETITIKGRVLSEGERQDIEGVLDEMLGEEGPVSFEFRQVDDEPLLAGIPGGWPADLALLK